MKVIAIVENIADEYGGPANSIPSLLNALSCYNIDSEIFSVRLHDKEQSHYIEKFNITWSAFDLVGHRKLMYSPYLYKELKSKLIKMINNQEDIVLWSNNLWNYPAYIAYKLSKDLKLKHVISVRGSLYPWSLKQGFIQKKIAWYLFQKKSLLNASFVHVTCQDEFYAVCNLNIKSNVEIISHGINEEEFSNLPTKGESKLKLKLNPDKKYFLFMSRLHKKKGIELLINSWISAANDFPDWNLLIAGPDYDDYIPSITSQLEGVNMLDRVHFLGMVKGVDKLSALVASKFFVLPTLSENFGVVIGEALASGLPVLTTTGAPWKKINDYKCGYCIDLTQEKLTEKLLLMLSMSNSQLALMSENAIKLVNENYGWELQAKKFKELIE